MSTFLDLMGFAVFTMLCCAATAWWTSRNMRYQQSSLTQAVELMSRVAITMNENAALLLEFQRQMMMDARPKGRAHAPPAPTTTWSSAVVTKPRNNGHAEGPPPNVSASRIEV